MPCTRCQACRTSKNNNSGCCSKNKQNTMNVSSASSTIEERYLQQNPQLRQQYQQIRQQQQQLHHLSPATIRRLEQENAKNRLQINATSLAPPPCRSPHKGVEFSRRLAGTDQDAGPMPLFHDDYRPKGRYDVQGAPSSLTLGPVVVNRTALLRRSMEKLPLQAVLEGAYDDENRTLDPNRPIDFDTMWTNPDLHSPRPTRRESEKGVGDVRWWRKHVSFSLPYSPEVCDYDPNWINSAVQRVISDRGVTVHKLNSYAPQYWDPASAANLGEPTTTGIARSWSLEERAARSVGSVRAPVGVSLRCNHFLGNEAHLANSAKHHQCSISGKCIDGKTAAVLLSLARPRTISRGSERAANGLSLAKHSFSFEQSATNSYPGIYPSIGTR